MNRAEDLRHVTHLFPTFLGLRLLPVGVWFLVVGAAALAAGRLPTALQAVLAALAAAAIWPIHLWYRREFGTVEPERLGLGRNWMLLAGLGAALLVLGLWAPTAGESARLVLALVLILFGAAVLFALPRAFGSGWLLPSVVAILALFGAALFVYLAGDPARFASIGSLFGSTLGVLLCLAGWIEHRQLTRAMDRLGAADDV